MAQKPKNRQSKKPRLTAETIADSVLLIANKSGWNGISIASLARQMKVMPADIEAHFGSVTDILIHILHRVEHETTDAVSPYLSDNWRDNVMEILMARFDIANRNRKAFESLPQFLKKHPKSVAKLAPLFYETMSRMLKTARYPNANPLVTVGFGALYASVVDVWIKDKQADMPKTMSAIDKRLGHFESFSKYVQCRKP